jgi:hypothetical protein
VSETAAARQDMNVGINLFQMNLPRDRRCKARTLYFLKDQEELYEIHATPENFLSKLLLEVHRERG